MKKSIYLSIALMFVLTISKAQTAMQLTGQDCNGVSHDLFADLDAGKAVILHFFMPNCGACPPPAQKIQAMANHILATHPGTITAYAMPFNNTTTCAYTSTWTSSNNLSLYMPYDSGAVHVANYGGFGMPTVVLLGGSDHRVMFSTLSFSTSDTTIMRDSIMALLGITSSVTELPTAVSSFEIYPNPSSENVSITVSLNETAKLTIDVTDITGKQIAVIANENETGLVTKHFNTAELSNGIYLVRLTANGKTATQKLTVAH